MDWIVIVQAVVAVATAVTYIRKFFANGGELLVTQKMIRVKLPRR